jgi:hypothetical protein
MHFYKGDKAVRRQRRFCVKTANTDRVVVIDDGVYPIISARKLRTLDSWYLYGRNTQRILCVELSAGAYLRGAYIYICKVARGDLNHISSRGGHSAQVPEAMLGIRLYRYRSSVYRSW